MEGREILNDNKGENINNDADDQTELIPTQELEIYKDLKRSYLN